MARQRVGLKVAWMLHSTIRLSTRGCDLRHAPPCHFGLRPSASRSDTKRASPGTNIFDSPLALHLIHQEQNDLDRWQCPSLESSSTRQNSLEHWRSSTPFCSWVVGRKLTGCQSSRPFCSWKMTRRASEVVKCSCAAKAAVVTRASDADRRPRRRGADGRRAHPD